MTVAHHGSVARRALPYAVSLLALAAAAGCTASSPPSAPSSAALTTTAASATTTQAPTPTATPTADPAIAKIPAAARPETEQGALAFTKYFLSQVNAAFVGPEPTALQGLYEPSCKACIEFRDGAAQLAADGLRHKGVSVVANEPTIDEFTDSRRTVAIGVVQNSVPVVTTAGKQVRSTKAGSGTFLATLAFTEHWTVTNLQVVR